MPLVGVHRIVESQAALRGDRAAIVSCDTMLTYRDLNQRANGLARQMIARGVRRGSGVVLRMKRSPQLAVALLAVLKSGAAYMWIEEAGAGTMVLDGAPLTQGCPQTAANLPIVTRAHDIACMLPGSNGSPGTLLPHSTIMALTSHPMPGQPVWRGDAGALDLWLPLMTGVSVTLDPALTFVSLVDAVEAA